MKKILGVLYLLAIASTVLAQSSFTQKKHENYMGWGVLSAGAGLSIFPFAGMSLVGRHSFGDLYDGIVGIGYEATVGGETNFDAFGGIHYSVDIKLFPYECWFLAAGYSTIGTYMDTYAKSDGTFSTGYRHGTAYTAAFGYDFVGDLRGGDDIYFALKGGMKYDPFFQRVLPFAGFTLGVVCQLGRR
ncbi:hypothetical protein FACS1894195_4070 [Bacteroidia bacterium]|nr:hypothetical protein FACS1894195_4070 [Bacteroidia bacterium]